MSTVKESRVNFMSDKLEDESVAFQKFIKKYKKNRVFFFLEGDDDIDYYSYKIESYLGGYCEKWIEIVCHGRSKVIRIIADLSSHTKEEYRECAHFGIIDKDYYEVDQNPNEKKIYITPYYSVENFYVSTSCFIKILIGKFFVNDGDSSNNDYTRCIDNFLTRRREFIDIVRELDKYLRCNRIMYEEQSIDCKINARDLNLKDLVDINIRQVVMKNNVLDFLGKKAEEFDDEALKKSESFYENKTDEDLALLMRGKFMYYFINHYLLSLRHDNLQRSSYLFVDSYANSQKRGPERVKMRKTKLFFDVQNSDLLSTLSTFADYPDCLKEFLSKSSEVFKKVA